MVYDFRNPLDCQRFISRCSSLIEKQAVVDLTEKVQRSLTQNAYLHAIIGAVAMECGTSLDYAKENYFKRLCNTALFVREVDDKRIGCKVQVLRSTADLTKEEMSTAIDRFKRWAAEQGMYLPEPGDDALLREIEIEMAKMRKYL